MQNVGITYGTISFSESVTTHVSFYFAWIIICKRVVKLTLFSFRNIVNTGALPIAKNTNTF